MNPFSANHPDLTVSALAVDRESRHCVGTLLTLFRQAVHRGSRLVVVPFGFPEGEDAPAFFRKLAETHAVHIAAAYALGDRRVAAVFSPEGELLGETLQTHRLPDEEISLGDEIRPIPTAIGNIGLSIASDLLFPEVHWSLAQQGADLLIHFAVEGKTHTHFREEITPKARAFDLHRPFILCSSSSRVLKLVHNEEMEIGGAPMTGSVIYDQNGVRLAASGFSQRAATTTLRFHQHCHSVEQTGNLPVYGGLDTFKLYFNDSRALYFSDLLRPYAPEPKPMFRKRKIRIAILSHFYRHQLDKEHDVFFDLLREACAHQPDIILATEMEKDCRPDLPETRANLDKAAQLAAGAGAYLIIGGVREAAKPGGKPCSTAWLWDRRGELVFRSAIMLYGHGCGQTCFDTDFGRIGIRLCGDIYAPELDRLFALKGADIVFNPSMAWGPSGLIHSELNQARAMDNGFFIASAHLAFSDAGQRSHVIDPNGHLVAASDYYSNSVLIANIDLDSPRGVFVKSGERQVDPSAYLAGWRISDTHTLLSPQKLLALRRPELYHMLASDLPDHPFHTRDRGDGHKPLCCS